MKKVTTFIFTEEEKNCDHDWVRWTHYDSADPGESYCCEKCLLWLNEEDFHEAFPDAKYRNKEAY